MQSASHPESLPLWPHTKAESWQQDWVSFQIYAINLNVCKAPGESGIPSGRPPLAFFHCFLSWSSEYGPHPCLVLHTHQHHAETGSQFTPMAEGWLTWRSSKAVRALGWEALFEFCYRFVSENPPKMSSFLLILGITPGEAGWTSGTAFFLILDSSSGLKELPALPSESLVFSQPQDQAGGSSIFFA